MLKANNINDIQIALFEHLENSGNVVSPRNQEVMEVYPVTFILTNVLNRCTTLYNRNWNLIFAIGEFFWHLSQSNELAKIEYYSKNWREVSNDGHSIIGSCYGKKLFNTEVWKGVINELKGDKDSRRAVISLYDNHFLGIKTNDVSCTLSLQFLIRNNKLDLITTMRSNDIVWGLPNDVFIFTMIQEMLALELKIETGNYCHQVGSLHIYKRHYKLMNSLIKNSNYADFTMPKMTYNDFNEIVNAENSIRENIYFDSISLDEYWNNMTDVLKLRSKNISIDEKLRILDNSPYKEVLKLCPTQYMMPYPAGYGTYT